jgi:DNA-binding response OmpR family regulator
MTDIVVVTDRERLEPMWTLLGQLRRLGYNAHVISRTTYQAINQAPTPQVVLVDVGTREFRAGGNTISAIQAAWEYVPVILLAKGDEIPNLNFTQGLHDFITLPGTPFELDARLRFALWKTQGARAPRDVIQVESLRLNTSTYEVWVDTRKITLTYKEFELLKFFATHRKRVFSRDELLHAVWEEDYYGGTRTVDVHIRRLRSKLGNKVGDMINTVRNVGYRFG